MRSNILKSTIASLPDRQYLLTSAFFYIALVALAFFYGLLAITANPILVSLGAGLLVGMALLFKPKWNIWLVVGLGLTIVGLLPLFVSFIASKAAWGVSLLGFIVMASALLRVISHPQCSRNTPLFVWLALAFMLYAVFNSLLQWNSGSELITGFKRYFQVFGLIFAFAWISLKKNDLLHWKKLLLVVAIIQLPFAIYQLLVYVPMREGFRDAIVGLVPIDVVAGTFGATLYGGGSNAEMATFLLLCFAFLVARRREQILSTRKLIAFATLLLPPIFLGETKIIVIILPIIFLVLYRKEILLKPHKAFIGLVATCLLTVGAGYSYLSLTERNFEEEVEGTLEYNFYDQGYGTYALNRTTALTFWAERQSSHGPASAIIGNGLGSSHDPTSGHIATIYSGYGVGLTAASTLLWDLGAIGLALFLSILIAAWFCAKKIGEHASEAWIRADIQGIQVALVVFAFYSIYRVTLLETLSFQIIYALTLGYLAWIHRYQMAQNK